MIIIASYSNVSVTYTADGTQTVFSFPFDYLRKAFVYVEVNEETTLTQGTDYNVSGKTVVFATAPALGTVLRIYRSTDTTPLVSWADASVLRAKDMTLQQIQDLHILEEQDYWTRYNAMLRNGDTWDARGFQIKDVADPTDPTDAATKQYADNNFMRLNDDGNYWVARGLPVRNIATPGQVKDATTKEYVDNLIDALSVAADRYVVFDNVASMKAANLPAGYNTRTLGYYDINDGGAGTYSIRGKVDDETEDGGSIIFLENGNVAELITDGTITLEQFGCVGDGTTDNDSFFANIAAYCENKKIKIKGTKEYKLSNTVYFESAESIVFTGGKYILPPYGLKFTDCGDVVFGDVSFYTSDLDISGKAVATLHCKNFRMENCYAENFSTLYSSDAVATDDNTQFFMDNCFLLNVTTKSVLCPYILQYIENCVIDGLVSYGGTRTNELVYLEAGLKNCTIKNIYADYVNRFFIHANYYNNNLPICDMSLKQNHIWNLNISECVFDYGKVALQTDTYIENCVISNVYCGGNAFYPSTHSVTERVIFENCYIVGNILDTNSFLGTHPLIIFDKCKTISAITDAGATSVGWQGSNIYLKNCDITINGGNGVYLQFNNLYVEGCSIRDNTEVSGKKNVVQFKNSVTIVFHDNHLDMGNINRVFQPVDNNGILIAYNNQCVGTYSRFINDAFTPATLIKYNNYKDYVLIP